MPLDNAQDFRCLMPASHRRGEPAGARQMGGGGQIIRSLPRAQSTRAVPAMTLAAAGVSRTLPAEVQRGGVAAAATLGFTRQLPQPVARAAGLGQPAPAGDAPSPAPRPGSEPTPQPATRDRASLSVEALFPIVEAVARGISGAAGYAYMGEDPQGAGLRYGLLGLRLDTGDMGGALRLAAARDQEAALAALGPDGAALLAAAQAADRAARLQPVAGAPLWQEPWKSRLSAAAGRDIFRAAQNEYAVEALLRPAAALVLAQPGLASGTALAMALCLLAEMGREAGLETLQQILPEGIDSPAMLRGRLAAACPPCRLRLDELARDAALAEWRPAAPDSQKGGQS